MVDTSYTMFLLWRKILRGHIFQRTPPHHASTINTHGCRVMAASNFDQSPYTFYRVRVSSAAANGAASTLSQNKTICTRRAKVGRSNAAHRCSCKRRRFRIRHHNTEQHTTVPGARRITTRYTYIWRDCSCPLPKQMQIFLFVIPALRAIILGWRGLDALGSQPWW